jgi:hypothetical protein
MIVITDSRALLTLYSGSFDTRESVSRIHRRVIRGTNIESNFRVILKRQLPLHCMFC